MTIKIAQKRKKARRLKKKNRKSSKRKSKILYFEKENVLFSKIFTNASFKVSLHEHPLVFKLDEKLWLCQAKNVNKKCLHEHKKQTIPSKWEYGRSECLQKECNFYLCDWCSFKHMIEDE